MGPPGKWPLPSSRKRRLRRSPADRPTDRPPPVGFPPLSSSLRSNASRRSPPIPFQRSFSSSLGLLMAEIRLKTALLVPLQKDLSTDHSVSDILIYQGANFVGRNNLSVSDKRVSRKHICLQVSSDGSAEVVVEGPNPVILRSGDQRKRLSSQEKARIVHGDIIELLPSDYLFKYINDGNVYASSRKVSSSEWNEKRHINGDTSVAKRSRIVEEEVYARVSQVHVNKSDNCQSTLANVPGLHENEEAIRRFKISPERLSETFRLMQVRCLPSWSNTSSITINDVIKGNILIAILSNYMVDMDWLKSACPDLWKVPHVLVVHGESGTTVDHFMKNKAPNWNFHKPPLPISYGTHHSKAMLLVYAKGVRIIVHTANLIQVDWNNKTQGLWMQDFPWKDENNPRKSSLFENDLIDYLNTLKWTEFNAKLPAVGNVSINPFFFRKFDYSSAKVRLIASVPGYHMGPNMRKWGHMKLQNVLRDCIFDQEFRKSPLVYQFSSLGSLDEKWLAELAVSMSSGVTEDKSPLGIGKPLIIWPTVEDVRCSIEGYAAGNAIPSPQKNVEKAFLKNYWARWKANHVGRCHAMPHIKTYTRYNGQNLAWFLLTSANLSKAAWGALQKNNTQLMVRSYELGVLFLPSTVSSHEDYFSCTDSNDSKQIESQSSANANRKTRLTTLCAGRNYVAGSSEVIQLPVPYNLPPQPYNSEDVPWSWDRRYSKKDVHGQVWPRQV